MNENPNFENDLAPYEIGKFPHLKFQLENLKMTEELVSRLQYRKSYFSEKPVHDDPFTANENGIAIIETTMKLEKMQTSLIKKRIYLTDYIKGCKSILDEMATKFNEVMAKGRLLKDENSQLRELFANQKDIDYESNMEFKIRDYIVVKNILNPPKEEKSKGNLKKA